MMANLMSMDVSNASLHDSLGVANERGLGELLQNLISPHQAVVKTNTKNLDIIPSGDLSNIYSGILFAPQTTTFIESLKSDYDIILIDSPPLGIVEDVTLMMQQVNYNLMIFKARKTKIKTVKVAEKKVGEFKVNNVYGVFNGLKKKRMRRFSNSISITRKVWDVVTSCF